MESLPVDAPSTTITISSNESDDKNRKLAKDDTRQETGELGRTAFEKKLEFALLHAETNQMTL